MIRAGQHGEYEQKFINDKCFYITWNGLDCNLAQFATRDDLKEMLKEKKSGRKEQYHPELEFSTLDCFA